MVKVEVQDWTSGTTQVTLAASSDYYEIYGRVSASTYQVITDSNIAMQTRVGDNLYLVLNRENFRDTDFPLIILGFDLNDTSGTTELFGQTLETEPDSIYSRFAFGKRGNDCLNVATDFLSEFVTCGGNCFVKKSSNLSDIDAESARNNLELYSKEEIDRYVNGQYINNLNDFTYTIATRDTSANNPYCSSINQRGDQAAAEETWTAEYHYGSLYFEYRMTYVGCVKTTSYASPYKLGTLTELTGGRGVSNQCPIFIYPCPVKSNGQMPSTITFKHQGHDDPENFYYDAQEGQWYHIYYDPESGAQHMEPIDSAPDEGWYTITDGSRPMLPKYIPLMVVTGGSPMKYEDFTLSANSVYILHDTVTIGQGTHGDFDACTIRFQGSFVPNDLQLN